MSDPLGLFSDDNKADPLGLFQGAIEDKGFFSHAADTLKEAGHNLTLANTVTGILEGLGAGGGELGNAAISGLYGPAKSLFSGNSAADEIQNTQQSIRDTIPYMPETKAGQSLLSILGLLPEGIHAVGEKAFDATGSPLVGAGVEALGNALLFKGALKGNRAEVAKDALDIPETIKDLPKGTNDPLGLFDVDKGAMGDSTGQVGLFAPDEIGNTGRSPYGDLGKGWKVDENGMPFKPEESLDVQRSQQPAQESLFNPESEGEFSTPKPDLITKENTDLLRAEFPTENKPIPIERPTSVPSSKELGMINPAVFKEGFEKIKQLADGIALRAFSRDGDTLTITASKDDRKLGGALFDRTNRFDEPGQSDLFSVMTGISKEAQGKGLASEVYKFASELGNDIVPSKLLMDDGAKMWKGFNRRGLATDNVIRAPNSKQRGGLYLGDSPQKAQIERVIGKQDNLIPSNPHSWDIIQAAKASGKDGKGINNLESGASLTAMKRDSPLIQGVGRVIQNAGKRADLSIRNTVLPFESAVRSLSTNEMISLGKVLKDEMLGRKVIDPETLSKTLSTKQVIAYTHFRDMMNDTLRIQNEARLAKGEKPITSAEAYLSSRWEGDFRRPLYEKTGKGKKLVAFLASNTKMGLEHQTEALVKKFPSIVVDKSLDHVVRLYNSKTDLQSVYSTILDILGRDDPAVKRIQEALEAHTVNEGASFLSQEKHFESKSNVRGFIGDRPEYTVLGKSIHGPKSETLALFQQQVIYAKNAYKWSEMQKAAQELKPVFTDPELAQSQPNNMKYIKDYFKAAIGYGENKAVSHIMDAVRDLGVSPVVLQHAVGGTKAFFILQKLALSTGYTLSNIIQTTNVIPHLALAASKGYKGNYLSAMVSGIFGGIAMASSHYATALGIGDALFKGISSNSFISKAFKYAEDNGVTARSIYDESPIDASFSPLGKIGNAMGKTISAPEAFVRSSAFMTYAQFLKDSGKFTSDSKLFQKAEELTNISMVDYRAGERPLVFNKLGAVGDFLNTLQTYPINYYQQWNLFIREAAKRNYSPVIAALALQYATSGIQGIPGFNDLNKLYLFIKDHLPAKYWAKAQDNSFLSDPKLWMIEHFTSSIVYGVLSDKSGIGLTSRVVPPGVSDMLQSPIGPSMDLGKQLGHIASAAIDPTNSSKWAQVAQSSTPSGLTGLLEQSPMMEGKMFEKKRDSLGAPNGDIVVQKATDIPSHTGMYVRDHSDQVIRNFGLRSQKEVVERDLAYNEKNTDRVAQEKSKDIVSDYYDSIRRGDVKQATELASVYTKLTGKDITNEQLQSQVFDSYTSAITKANTAIKTVQAAKEAARTNAILEQIRRSQK